MRALRITAQGGPDVLKLQEVADPAPGSSEVSIIVRATALNRADLLQCKGLYPAPPGAPPDIPGLEYAGEILATGAQAKRFKVGDRVMGLLGGGAFAERAVAHENEVLPMPAEMSFTDAAAIPEAFITAHDAMVVLGGLAAGQGVLIHAVGSGVGTAACQIAAALDAVSIGTSRSADKLERCKRELGLSHGITVASPPKFLDAVKAATKGRGADVVLDLAGGDYLPENVEAAAPRGRIIVAGLLAGPSATVPLGRLLQKRLQIIGTVLRSRSLQEKIAVAQRFERDLLALFGRGRLKPVVDAVHSVEDVQAAFARMSSNQSFGKIVLQW